MSGAHPPVLGLALAGSGTDLVALLAALQRWCEPQSLHNARHPVAVLADMVMEPGEYPRVAPGLPVAVASRNQAVLAAAGPAGIYPPDGESAGGARYVPPFVRARLRAERGLPDAVLTPDRRWPGRGVLPDELLETALGCAVAVVADTPALAERALAWGAPLICDAATAGALHLTPGTSALIDTDPAVIATNPRLAARLSCNGRRAWERRHDASQAAAALACWLLPSSPDIGSRHLAALDTPPNADVVQRLRSATPH